MWVMQPILFIWCVNTCIKKVRKKKLSVLRAAFCMGESVSDSKKKLTQKIKILSKKKFEVYKRNDLLYDGYGKRFPENIFH